MSTQQFSQKRLLELEKLAKEYTDEDLLNEADEIEKDLLSGNISYDLPDDFFSKSWLKENLLKRKECGMEIIHV